MGREIERKFLVNLQKWEPGGKKEFICQGYLSNDCERIVRVRICGSKAFLTIKGKSEGISRNEFNFSIPISDAEELMKIVLNKPIEKYRYKIVFQEKLWEVDVFTGINEGLFLAEVELNSVDEKIEIPPWVGEEVSFDKRYFNSYLSEYPFSTWENKK